MGSVGTCGQDAESLQGRRDCPPTPTWKVFSQHSAPRESTHSVGSTVGGMFVLCGLVPLVGGDSVVHEPETRSTGPENSVTESQEARRPQPYRWKGGVPPASLPPSLPPSLYYIVLDYPILCASSPAWCLSQNSAKYQGAASSPFPIFNFLYASLTHSAAPQGYSLTNFYIRTQTHDHRPGQARAHLPPPESALTPLPPSSSSPSS